MKPVPIFIALVIVGIALFSFSSLGNFQKKSSTPDGLLSDNQTRDIIDYPKVNNDNNNQAVNSAPSDAISSTSAVIKTEKGNIVLELYPQDAPRTVMNFTTLSSRGYYDNLTFHRVEEWVIQGGDPSGNGSGGTSIYGNTFEDELNPNTKSYKGGYVRGVLAMANRGPNTNGSQFFILTKDTPLDHAYTIFGKVTSGMDVVDQIQVGDKFSTIEVGN
ncbi:MAG: hypothetical protein COU27_03125 [Candidatus Levybacteria bacterium CG10_big_fil_rev_8_21_14_0_10_36_7]|nr:MAG: hypothetical protein COU27_03125 [Candidatus Levybacteria bacterium CG10_big_fil_rev_8_21_14_0_10_36_7]